MKCFIHLPSDKIKGKGNFILISYISNKSKLHQEQVLLNIKETNTK